jgi:hypothetical protein
MNTQTIIRLVITFVIYLFLQIFVIRNFVLFDVAFCFVYVGCILLLPNEIGTGITLLLSFLVGLTVDIFYNTAGIHASATVLMGYMRGSVIKFLFPTKGMDTEIIISLKDMGGERFIRYIVILTLLHHTLLFFVEAGNLQQLFIITVLKIVCSVIFTTFMIFLLQYLRRDN